MTLDDRWKVVKKHHLCFVGFDDAHTAKTCKSNQCENCSLPHHSLLHKDEGYISQSKMPSRVKIPSPSGNTTVPKQVEGKPENAACTNNKNALLYLKETHRNDEKVAVMLLKAAISSRWSPAGKSR